MSTRRLAESRFIHELKWYFGRRWKSAAKYASERRFLKYCDAANGGLALDFGANVGDVTEYLLQKGLKVIAFEPDPRCLEVLHQRFSNNANVQIMPVAVSVVNTDMKLFVQGGKTGNTTSSSLIKRSKHTKDFSYTISAINIFEFMKTLPSPPYLTKMDIEGAEFDILEKMLDSCSPDMFGMLFVETHERFSEDFKRRHAEISMKLSSSNLVDLGWG